MENKKNLILITEPDERLHQISEPVKKIDNDINETLNEMINVMEKFDGIGLAAPQVGILKRMLIIDNHTISMEEDKEQTPEKILKIINPEIIEISKEKCTKEEGCLSLPTVYYSVERPERIKIKYLNENGVEKTLEADGLLARCIEHEIDHLNGKVFIDYVGPLKKRLALNKLKKMKIIK